MVPKSTLTLRLIPIETLCSTASGLHGGKVCRYVPVQFVYIYFFLRIDNCRNVENKV